MNNLKLYKNGKMIGENFNDLADAKQWAKKQVWGDTALMEIKAGDQLIAQATLRPAERAKWTAQTYSGFEIRFPKSSKL